VVGEALQARISQHEPQFFRTLHLGQAETRCRRIAVLPGLKAGQLRLFFDGITRNLTPSEKLGMSRLHRYKHALLSGYAMLGANILYTLASVPLALAYLSRSEFGLWALMTQIGGYVALVDLGMSGAVARILVDYKDHPGNEYGSTVLTSALVGIVQGILVLLAGLCLAFIGGGLLRVPADLQRQFMWLLVGQSAIQAFAFSTRTLPLVLTAHQRYDVTNYSQVGLFVVNYVTLWAGFALGFGVYSSIWSQAIIQVLTTAINAWWCVRLSLLPSAGKWGKPTWGRFKELFSFGKDVFLFAVGSQMVNASQAILVTPLLGLEAAGVWSVCTRVYAVVTQLVGRIFDFSSSALSELLVRGESAKLFERFRSITILTSSMALIAAVLFGLCNQPFVAAWAKGRFGWAQHNDVLLGVWLVLMSVQRCHSGILGAKKQLGTVKYVYFAEGCMFIGLASITTHVFGYSGVIASSIVATGCFSFSYGLWRTKTDFRLTWREVASWLQPAVRVGAVLVPWAVAVAWLSASLQPMVRLVIAGGTTAIIGTGLLLRWGLDESMQQLASDKLPSSLQGLLGLKRSHPVA
jgi:O-antigen/teichoic acid export membrane protein